MALIDFTLNVACLLLWLNWRFIPFDPLGKGSPTTLAGTLRRTAPQPLRRWHFLLALAALLYFRALLYWQVGAAVGWTPNLRLGAIAIAFRSDFVGCMLLFSIFSFVVTLAVFYFWLLFLSAVNGREPDVDQWQRLGRLHLGRVDRWPWPIKLILPWLVVCLLWLVVNPILARLNIVPPALSATHRLEQAVVIGLGAYLSWKYLIAGLLALYLVNTYVFLGQQTFWTFVGVTGRNVMIPLRWLPLRFGKADFAPLAEIVVVFLAATFAERGLTILYQRLPI